MIQKPAVARKLTCKSVRVSSRNRRALSFFLLLGFAVAQAQAPAKPADLELVRPAHTWEFLNAVGDRAGLFGTQDGKFEAWVYPLKLLRDFHLVFTADGREFPAESLARTITAHAESVTITYSGDDFTVTETWFVPVGVAGAVVQLDVETWTPLGLQARFQPDMQMMWPAPLGPTKQSCNSALHAFAFSDETKYYGLVGAQGADVAAQECESQGPLQENVMHLPAVKKGRESRLIVIAGSVNGREEAEATYRRLLSDVVSLRDASAAHYREFLDHTTSIEVPNPELQQAYDWARISMVQGMVDDPLLGKGLVAGYGRSGKTARPGFAWFFGRDSEWTSLAMDSIGDFADVRTALEFLIKFQRSDGKVEHEIAQSAALVPWFSDYDYAYASADATPLFLIAMDQYVRASGDITFLRAHWDSVWRAYSFLRSTWDDHHHPKNLGIGHGWVEGGPLLPVQTELYQSGLGVQALLCLDDMAHMSGQPVANEDLEAEAERQRKSLDQDFWSDHTNAYAFALDQQNARLDTPSVLTTVPMWFGLLDPAHSQATINLLAGPDHMADWGMRILSADDPRYEPAGYHYGSVWPLFTGWAAVGEYRYHRPLPAYANLQANALLTLSGAGRTTEVLSGSYFDSLLPSSPHQIWSSAMVVSPILRGMMGLEASAPARTLAFAPHVPASWNQFKLHNLWVGNTHCDLAFARTEDEISVNVEVSGGELKLHLAPAIALRAHVLAVTIDGHPVKFHEQANGQDQHVEVDLRTSARATVRIRLQHDFDVEIPASLPAPGQASRGVHVVAESWSSARNQLTLQMFGFGDLAYDFAVRGEGQVTSVEGGNLVSGPDNGKVLRVQFHGPARPGYTSKTVVIHFKN